MKRKYIMTFIRENRPAIDAVILKRVPGLRLNDEDRRQWILNLEVLYLWAKAQGVRI
jgi:hypothetical protein